MSKDRFEEEAKQNQARHQFLDELVAKQLDTLQALADDPETPAGVRQKACVDLCRIAEKERKRTGSSNPAALRIQERNEKMWESLPSL